MGFFRKIFNADEKDVEPCKEHYQVPPKKDVLYDYTFDKSIIMLCSTAEYDFPILPAKDTPFAEVRDSYICDYCGCKSPLFDKRGNCISCGAPVK